MCSGKLVPFLADLASTASAHMRSDLIEVQAKKNNDRAICLAKRNVRTRAARLKKCLEFVAAPWLSQIVAETKIGLSSVTVLGYISY